MADGPDILLTSQSGQIGGMELRMIEEARALRELGYQAGIATNRFSEGKMFERLCHKYGIPYNVFGPPDFMQNWRWRYVHRLHAQLTARRAWRRKKPDLCHVFLPWTDQGLARIWLAARSNIATVVSIHNTFPIGEFVPWHERHVLEAFLSLRGGYAVSHSALVAFETIFGRYLPDAIELRVIHNFVDTERFVPSLDKRRSTRGELDIPQDALVIGSVGRLADQKKPESIVRLFARLRPRFPNLYLVLVGQGPLEKAVRRLADSLGVTPYVKLTGFVEKTETVYPALDLHVLLSRNEGFGISTIEAMSCGVPVIGTDVPGTRDILRNSCAGILVPLNNELATAEAASRLLIDADFRRTAATAGRTLAICRYSKARWLEETAEYYDEILTKIGNRQCA